MELSDFKGRLRNVRKGTSGYTAKCPNHDDRHNSLSFSETPDKILLKCFAGCSVKSIVSAMGLQMEDLFRESYSERNNGQRKEIADVYDYCDENGNLLYQNVRFEPKDFRQRHCSNGNYIWNLDGVRRVPYRLPELIKGLRENSGSYVLFTEGEKDCDRLRKLGFIASSFKNWRAEFNCFIENADVILLCDHDRSGIKQANDVAVKIRPSVKSLKIIDLFADRPLDDKHGLDVSDWLDMGDTPERLVEIINQSPAFNPNTEESVRTRVEGEIIKMPVLSEKALYGLAGEVVRIIKPHTEADISALLVQFLAGFGNLIGKTAYFLAEADYHYTKIFIVLVGASSKGRKGTSWGYIRKLLIRVDETFDDCIQDGLSSGEGVIYHVRDKVTKKTPIKEKSRIIDYQDEIIDEGAKDKRLFLLEPEFARVLKVMRRETNTLSSIIRQAWDTDRLRVLTKTPLRASDTHISIVGHITKGELKRNLDESDMANGFANRFLFVFTKRSGILPEGGNLQESELNNAVMRLRGAVNNARLTTELKRDEKARQLWRKVYPKLSVGHTGLLGAVTSRAEAQVMRLATLYALLDCSDDIRFEHLEAALALWQYCEDSARYIFGEATGDKLADTILDVLKSKKREITRTEIRDLFNRNKSQAEINRALQILCELGQIEIVSETTEGRPVEIVRLLAYDKNDINDETELKDSFVVNVVDESEANFTDNGQTQISQIIAVETKNEPYFAEGKPYDECLECNAKNDLDAYACWNCGDVLIKF